MAWRIWLVRGLVFSVLGLVAFVAVLYVLYTDPARVRLIVQEKLGVKFDRVSVQLGSARFRLLGGVLVNELRLARSDGLDSSDFLYVPSAVLFHDKEHLLDGKIQVRRVEFDRPQLRLVRLRDGRLNLQGLTTAGDPGDRLPTIIVRGGTLVLEDQQLAPGVTLLEIRKVQLTALNDPLPVVQIECTGHADVLGPVRIKATFDRRTQAVEASIHLGQIPVDAALFQRLAVVVPEASKHLSRLKGKGQIEANVQYTPGKCTYQAQARMQEGQWSHPLLHAPLEAISCRATLRDGHMPEAHLRARLDGAAVEMTVRDFTLPQSRNDLDNPAALLAEMNVKVDHLPVTYAAMKALPPGLKFLGDDYSPSGPLSVHYSLQRHPSGVPRQVWIAKPEGMTAMYHEFRYAVRDIRGEIRVDATHLPRNDITMNLTGSAGNSPVELKGTFKGSPQSPELRLRIRGKDLLLDHHLVKAMPSVAQSIVGQFLPSDSRQWGLERCPMGLADFDAEFVRQANSREVDKTIRVNFKKARVRYDQFPYPLEDVFGTLILYPDHWEARGFHGRYEGGEIGVEGRSYRLPDRAVAGADGTRREEVRVTVTGKNIHLGKTFEEALVPDAASVKGGAPERKAMQAAWRRLQLSGRLNFRAIIKNHPDHTPDVDFWIELLRCRMKPLFFAYGLEDVSGSVRYHQGNIFLDKFAARHGVSPLHLEWGLIQPRGDGQVSAWLDRIHASNLVIDDDLLKALPEGLAKACRTLKIGPLIDLKNMDLRLVTSEPGAPPTRASNSTRFTFARESTSAAFPDNSTPKATSMAGRCTASRGNWSFARRRRLANRFAISPLASISRCSRRTRCRFPTSRENCSAARSAARPIWCWGRVCNTRCCWTAWASTWPRWANSISAPMPAWPARCGPWCSCTARATTSRICAAVAGSTWRTAKWGNYPWCSTCSRRSACASPTGRRSNRRTPRSPWPGRVFMFRCLSFTEVPSACVARVAWMWMATTSNWTSRPPWGGWMNGCRGWVDCRVG
jgi:hypothetical protein